MPYRYGSFGRPLDFIIKHGDLPIPFTMEHSKLPIKPGEPYSVITTKEPLTTELIAIYDLKLLDTEILEVRIQCHNSETEAIAGSIRDWCKKEADKRGFFEIRVELG